MVVLVAVLVVLDVEGAAVGDGQRSESAVLLGQRSDLGMD